MSQTLAAPSSDKPFYTGANSAKKLLSLVGDKDKFLREIKPPTASKLTFQIDGILFKANHAPDGKVSHLTIWAELGYLPYSVNSSAKRKQLIAILEGTHILPHIKFGVDSRMRILVTGEYKITKPPSPDYLFIPLIRFLEESLPFIRLIGEYL